MSFWPDYPALLKLVYQYRKVTTIIDITTSYIKLDQIILIKMLASIVEVEDVNV